MVSMLRRQGRRTAAWERRATVVEDAILEATPRVRDAAFAELLTEPNDELRAWAAMGVASGERL